MGIFDNDCFSGGNYNFPPKVGQSRTIKIDGIETVQDPGGQRNYKDKNKKDFGYYHLLDIGEDKKMIVNVWKLYFALKESGVNIGESVIINHKASGEYIITKLIPKAEQKKMEFEP